MAPSTGDSSAIIRPAAAVANPHSACPCAGSARRAGEIGREHKSGDQREIRLRRPVEENPADDGGARRISPRHRRRRHASECDHRHVENSFRITARRFACRSETHIACVTDAVALLARRHTGSMRRILMTLFRPNGAALRRHIALVVCLRARRPLRRSAALYAPPDARIRSRRSCRARHGGGAGKARGASRRRHPAAGRQCGRCRGRHRLCDGRDLSARRKYRRRRLHGDSFGRARRRHRDRLSRDRAGRDDARHFSRRRRQARHRQVARFGARHRRARHGRGAGAGAGEIRLRQVHAGADPQARDRSGARRLCHRRRHRRHAAGHVPPAGAMAVRRKRFRAPTARRCARATGWCRPIWPRR